MKSSDPVTILVVDDQASQRLLTAEILLQSGFAVLESDNGQHALETFKASPPSAILLDVMMPGIDGFEACERIRTLPGGRHVPIMLMTAREDEEAIKRAYDVGATDFVTKPVNPLILKQRVRYMLRAASVAADLRRSQVLLDRAEQIAQSGAWEWHPSTKALHWTRGFAALFDLVPCAPNRVREEFLACFDSEAHDVLHRLFNEDEPIGLPKTLHHRLRSAKSGDGNEERYFETRITLKVDDDKTTSVSGITSEVTAQHLAQERIRNLAYSDSITGLPNRTAFVDQAPTDLARTAHAKQIAAVLHIDIDEFKRLNEFAGRDSGDRVLAEVATRVRNSLRAGDKLGRGDAPGAAPLSALGGDEFIVLLPGVGGEADAIAVADRIRAAFAPPISIEAQEFQLTASIGIALFPDHADNIEELLRRADSAVSEAKRLGKDRTQVYEEAFRERRVERISIGNLLRHAVQHDELEVHYQPKINLHMDQVAGMEALVRWTLDDGRTISPAEFIPIAEESDLIHLLGCSVLETACAQAVEWCDQGFPALEMSVNLSFRQLERPNLADEIEAVLAKTRLEPHLLCLEVTESGLMQRVNETVATLNRLKRLGCRIAIDDFGTGYSSLSYLQQFPIDVLKIDRSFIVALDGASPNPTVVTAVIRLAQTLGLTVVAEGVETETQAHILKQLGCDEIQGYYYGKPQSANDFGQWLAARRAVSTVVTASPGAVRAP